MKEKIVDIKVEKKYFSIEFEIPKEEKMNLDDLAGVLSEMYENASDGDKVSMIHLFGIRYSSEIKNKGYTAGDIIKKTKLKNEKPMSDTYKTEISKGIRLADFVVDKEKLRDLLIGIL